MVSELESGSTSLGSRSDQVHFVVLLIKTLYSHIASPNPEWDKGRGEFRQVLGIEHQVGINLLLQEMAVMKRAILGLHSSRGSTSQVTRTNTGVHGPQSHLRTSTVGSAPIQAAYRPKPTIFVSDRLLI